MDRLAEQVVAWHNRNPLAKRISIFDVHTIGVVALPFMRSGGLAQEPALDTHTPALDANALDALPGTDAMVAAAEEAAASSTAPKSAAGKRQGLAGLAAGALAALPASLSRWRRLLPQRERAWALFSERFISRLSRRAIVSFALKHGYGTVPGSADWPMRTVAVDERLMHEGSGAWPYEIYLISAGIDAGSSRTRVLMARHPGQALAVLGRRCLNPLAVAAALALPAALLASLSVLMWPAGTEADRPAAAASAASAAVAASAASAAAPAAPLTPAASMAAAVQPAVSAPAAEASAVAAASAGSAAALAAPLDFATSPAEAASAAASAAAAAAAQQAQTGGVPASSGAPDIRPRLVVPARRPRASEPAGAAAPPAASATATATVAPRTPMVATPATGSSPMPKPAAPSTRPASGTAALDEDGRLPRVSTPAPGARQVALVGPVFAKRDEAQAMLVRMNRQLSLTVRDPGRLQAQLFQTPEGWRPAIFPFGSREEAQLINATLIASGLRTRAVDF